MTQKINVIALIVTYGSRQALLEQVLVALAAESFVVKVIVIDNGTQPPISAFLNEHSLREADWIQVVEVGFNSGSAGGYARALAEALKFDSASHFLLLDDDNRPDSGALSALLALQMAQDEPEETIGLALRRGRTEYENLLSGQVKNQILPNSFLGFHLAEIPKKLFARMSKKHRKSFSSSTAVVELDVAPYGGLLLPSSLVRRVGLPRADFLLYGDDHEYTARLRASGARILLTGEATITDVDISWNDRASGINPWVDPASPAWRVYYACRNRIYVERKFTSSQVLYQVNKWMYLSLLKFLAQRYSAQSKRGDLMRPVLDALRDAKHDHFGERIPYCIPNSMMSMDNRNTITPLTREKAQ